MVVDLGRIREELDEKDQAREASIKKTRILIRTCGDGIRALHRGEGKKVEEAAGQAQSFVTEIRDDLRDHPDILNSSSVRAGFVEYAEFVMVMKLLNEKTIPSISEVDIPPVAYLNGMGDAIGEIRRHILDLLRRGETSEAEEYLVIAQNMYDLLMTFDYPKAIIGGLRRRQDVARSLLERTRADVTNAVLQKNLSDRLEGSQG